MTYIRAVIFDMGGTLEIASTPGTGTQVTISVPAPDSLPATVAGSAGETEPQLLSPPSRSMQRPVK